MPHPSVSVIIPVYNDYQGLYSCLAALEKQTYPREKYEVIVVDNGSKDIPQPPLSSEFRATWLQELKTGSYAARNLGIRSSKGEVLAFTDADCIPGETWIEEGVKLLQHLKGPGYVTGKVVSFPRDPKAPTWTELYEMSTAFQFDVTLKDLHFGGTCNLFVWRKVVEDVGLFDDSLLSGGDAEFGRRVYEAGYQQAFSEKAVVRHPARHRFQERLHKAYRVYCGGLALARKGDRFAQAQFSKVSSSFKFPARKFYKILKAPQVEKKSDRLKAAGVMLALHYQMAMVHFKTVVLKKPPEGTYR